ncbi:mechanosensitive ion channel [Marinobacterium maritimum]|uniref:Mechanosensitive ion channel n=1 Tax=Marinobacterium maritimum TaxID=500162 RepID=A0ABP3T5F2_9GAMM
MDTQSLRDLLEQWLTASLAWLTSPSSYYQLLLVLFALLFAYLISLAVGKSIARPIKSTDSRPIGWLRRFSFRGRNLALPLFSIIFLAIAADISDYLFGNSTLIRLFEIIAVVSLAYIILSRFVSSLFIKNFIKIVVIPIVLLQLFGLLDTVVAYLDSLALEIGNIRISAQGLIRVLIFGSILFWLGRISNTAGQRIIRQQQVLDIGTREVFAKLYQVALIIVIFLLLLQIMGINITALAVFSGALGVGLGFGLQSIASNFISGLIILLDQSLSVGDYIELDDGRTGTIRELNMRSTTLETYDGKDIMVPNERFITNNFINWTHKNKKQRYSITFQVAYDTDLHMLFDLLRQVVASHPQVLNGQDVPIEERPDAEICGFGESGVDILVEFWMEGIDDGVNRVGGDLYLMIWDALKEHQVEIPYPQRVVRMAGEEPLPGHSPQKPQHG